MMWVEIKEDLSNMPKDGQYIVKTKTMFNWNVLKVTLRSHIEKGKKKYNWSCNNQKVTHYLYEDAD